MKNMMKVGLLVFAGIAIVVLLSRIRCAPDRDDVDQAVDSAAVIEQQRQDSLRIHNRVRDSLSRVEAALDSARAVQDSVNRSLRVTRDSLYRTREALRRAVSEEVQDIPESARLLIATQDSIISNLELSAINDSLTIVNRDSVIGVKNSIIFSLEKDTAAAGKSIAALQHALNLSEEDRRKKDRCLLGLIKCPSRTVVAVVTAATTLTIREMTSRR